ncbi:hypothetical protein [Erythrobacter sp. R86502]|uniref:hypothetical protein n=1 Tax=Erythrobacter sp. R86502 TaxID=3093846 RepID=UPI0036D23A64
MLRFALAALVLIGGPLAARESLGVYDGWAAFKDDSPLRCYAIAKAQIRGSASAYMTVSYWPDRQVRGAVHMALSQTVADGANVRLSLGANRFTLVAKGRHAWAKDMRDDAAIVAALRSVGRLRVSATATNGRSFTDQYALAGSATAIDAATVGCARLS